MVRNWIKWTIPARLQMVTVEESPICEDEESEEDRAREWVKKRALELQRGAELMLHQVSQPGSSIWLRSMMGQNMGGDVGQMVGDVRHFTETGNIRPTTHAKGHNKASARYTRNTMGFMKD
ncbi:hypothetical protein B0H13DRAFT_1911302 [Mycena leptocephala]|nr:hypothetical protein B0H13DRAFT_1911302 [Mycena leptocephala]